MNVTLGNAHYQTKAFDDPNDGCTGLILFSTIHGETKQKGKITFWDACGQFFIELNGGEAPLEIIEQLIAEAKQAVPIE